MPYQALTDSVFGFGHDSSNVLVIFENADRFWRAVWQDSSCSGREQGFEDDYVPDASVVGAAPLFQLMAQGPCPNDRSSALRAGAGEWGAWDGEVI